MSNALRMALDLDPGTPLPTKPAEIDDRMEIYDDESHENWHRLYYWFSTKLCESLIDNIDTAAPLSIFNSHSLFTRFPDLPKELRCKIWGLAVAFPRIIELQHTTGGDVRDPTEYHPKEFPALLQTCREAREESLRIHEKDKALNTENYVATSLWMRYDYDIFHIRHINLVSPELPAYFYNIEALAISWDLIVEADWHYGLSLRTSVEVLKRFEKLRVLIILIDDTVDIPYAMEPGVPTFGNRRWTKALEKYELRFSKFRRREFVSAATGPFGKITRNTDFEILIHDVMTERYRRMEAEMRVIPRFVVRSCVLPAGFVSARANSRD